jgi:hypothetical protein
MCTLRSLRRVIGVAVLALVLVPPLLGVYAAEAGRRTHSFINGR